MAEDWGIISVNGLVLADVGATGAVNEGSSKATADVRVRAQPNTAPVLIGAALQERDYVLKIRQGLTTTAFDSIMAAIDTGGEPWQLVATHPNQSVIALMVATKKVLALGSLEITVRAPDPVWRTKTPITYAKIFRPDGLDSALALPIPGHASVEPNLRIQPQGQRTAGTATVGWKYRKRVFISNPGPGALVNYPYMISFGDTAALVAAGKALGSGNDLRVFWQGKELPRAFVAANGVGNGWNTVGTRIWIIIPNLPPGASMIVDVAYGNPQAGAPPTFVYSKNNPYGTTVLDLANSANTQWYWNVSRTLANAYRGLWYIQPGIDDHEVPGSWDRALFYRNRDAFWQEPSSTFTVTGSTYGIATFRSQRFKKNAVTGAPSFRDFDGVSFYSPIGIVSATFDLDVQNSYESGTVGASLGRVDFWARHPGGSFRSIWSDNTRRTTTLGNTIIGNQLINVQNNGENAVQIGFSAGPRDGNVIPRNADADSFIDARNNTTLYVTLPDVLTPAIGAEEPVYDLTAIVRFGGGQNTTPAAPRGELSIAQNSHLLIGYATGGGTADELRIDTDAGRLAASIWSADGLGKREDVPWAVSPRIIESLDFGEATRLGQRPILKPQRERITNTMFAANITGWAAAGNTAGMTTTTSWDSGTSSLQVAVTANTGGTGEFARARYSTDIPVTPGDAVVLAADVRSTTLTMWGELELAFVTATGAEFGQTYSPAYTPVAINTPYRRSVGGTVPPGAVSVRLGLRARPVAAGNTGTVRFTAIDSTGNELVWLETAPGAVFVTVLTRPGWL